MQCHPKFLSNEICLILCNLLVERLFFLNFIVDNGKVVRAVHKVGQVQGVVPVLVRERVDRMIVKLKNGGEKRWKKMNKTGSKQKKGDK